ncbi:PHB depolymerase family esterase [Massilia sp. NR 4-1]|uniref:extracellular catalytic domain type 1 short-chain-length polyhydroxyalkanoate depolymerase n=1 Tax=Massilia sp. NR 4-1 TaxID=1678028 RepID=UPI00067CE352|nr:PHB depolymerase family esterase [Massilia sp. NR 4-1]AKU21911.1 PHB depolymerase esterase [Massilia sp. NR 4-1]
MKPFEQFLGQMMEAARLAQAKDPQAATDVIQKALKAAGLLPGQAAPAAEDGRPELIDLNALPEWVRKARGGATADGVPQPARRARWNMPGRKRSRAPAYDPRAPGEFMPGSFQAGAGSRRYKLYVPSTPATGPRPLIVMLHGCTQDPDDFAAGTAMNALAEQHGCLVLYPEQDRSANASLCWNWFETPHQQRDGGEPSLIAGMTREVIERWGADPQRVYVAGLSAGGAMAAIMGAAYPDLYAAVGVHSGLPVGKARDLITGLAAMKKGMTGKGRAASKLRQRVPVIVFHGDRDEVVHAGNGEAVLEQFLHAAPASRDDELRRTQERDGDVRYTKTAMLDRSGRSVAEHWELHGAGHAWSGGSPAGSYTHPAGPDASAEMLRFFLGQTG